MDNIHHQVRVDWNRIYLPSTITQKYQYLPQTTTHSRSQLQDRRGANLFELSHTHPAHLENATIIQSLLCCLIGRFNSLPAKRSVEKISKKKILRKQKSTRRAHHHNECTKYNVDNSSSVVTYTVYKWRCQLERIPRISGSINVHKNAQKRHICKCQRPGKYILCKSERSH